jgi:hypothetical protein
LRISHSVLRVVTLFQFLKAQRCIGKLQSHLVSSELRTHPRAQFSVVAGMGHPGPRCGETSRRPGSPIPATVTASSKLLHAYLAIGRKNLWAACDRSRVRHNRFSHAARSTRVACNYSRISCDKSGNINIFVGPAGILFAIGRTCRGEPAGYLPGETPDCPTGSPRRIRPVADKMSVLRCDYTDEHRISWNLARIRRHIFLALRTR